MKAKQRCSNFHQVVAGFWHTDVIYSEELQSYATPPLNHVDRHEDPQSHSVHSLYLSPLEFPIFALTKAEFIEILEY